jgi:hypothetical protein
MSKLRWLKRKDGELVLQHSVLEIRTIKDENGNWVNVGGHEWRDVPIEEEVCTTF